MLLYGGARERRNETAIEGFADSDYVDYLDTKKSLTGFVFTAFGTTMIWKATL